MVFNRQTQTIIVAILAIIMIASLIMMLVGFNTPKILQEKTYVAKAEIGKTGGVALDNTAVNFGRISKYSAAQKEIEVTNPFDEEVKVYAFIYGDIADFVEIRPRYVVLEPENKVKIVAQFNSGNASYGNYTGYLRVVITS